MPQISFVIPVYNTSKDKIERCVNSIINQKVSKEIIIVDDGSKPEYGKVYDTLYGDESGVKVVHISNAGAANARNIGIENAIGEYVVFVDSDDFIPENQGYSEILNIMEKKKLDVALGCNKEKSSIDFPVLSTKDIQIMVLRQQSINHVVQVGSPWAKVFKRSFLNENNVRFNRNLRRSHDRMFILNCFEAKPKFEIVNIVCYRFCPNADGSLSRSLNKKTKDYLKNYLKACIEFVNKYHGNDEEYVKTIDEMRVFLFRQYAQQGPFHQDNKEKFRVRYKEMVLEAPNILADEKAVIKYSGKSMEFFSRLAKYRLYFLIALSLEIYRRVKYR